MGIIVYTANFGNYDVVKPTTDTSAQYVLYSDNGQCPVGWKHIPVAVGVDGPLFQARYVKTHPPRAEFVVWHDACVALRVPAEALLQYLGDCHIATFRHPLRDCIYDEAQVCLSDKRITQFKDQRDRIERQMAWYKETGYPAHNGLAETTVVIRRCTEEMRKFNELWSAYLTAYSLRDQLSFDYLCWKAGIRYGIIPGNVRHSDLFDWHWHG